MKKVLLGLTATAVLTAGVFTFIGCEKENTFEKINSKQITKASSDDPQKIVFIRDVVKEGGTPIKFLGITIRVGYNNVSKSTDVYVVNGLQIRRTTYTCLNGGSERCRFNGHSYGTNPNPDDDWLNIDTNICVNRANINAFIDQMLDTVDVRLTQTGQFTGSIICEELFPTQTDDFVTLRFETEWTGGNADGDANVEITVYYDPEQ